MTKTLAWGIAGTGSIARKFAGELPYSRTGRLVAVSSRSPEKARAFAEEFGAARGYGSYEEMLADSDVEAVYIASPHPEHAWMSISAAEAGKHILCEKPAALNHADAMVMIEAARRHGVFFMEAFMYRCHPRTRQLWELVAQKRIGRPLLIEASFSFAAAFRPGSRLFEPGLGGGGILDVGCYTLSIARLLAGAARGCGFAEPRRLKGAAVKTPGDVDAFACATLEFEGGLLAQVVCGVGLARGSELRVTGESGALLVPNFWNPPGPIEVRDVSGGTVEILASDPNPHKYALEADAVAQALPGLESPCVPLADTLGNMAALDQWRREAQVVYPDEQPSARKLPVSRKPLRRREECEIPRRAFQGKNISRLVLGCDHQKDFCEMAALADDFFERGGNAFDTAFVYRGGKTEALLGQWMENRGVRRDCFVIVKGAHTPCCDPGNLLRQFTTSLERLRMEQADLYLMHRDNPDIPASVFFDVLDGLRLDGRAKAVGVSNWTLARVLEANGRAAATGRPPLDAASNQFSLARMADPVWPGCESANSPAWRDWLKASRTPLFAWSSQARGFFLDPMPATSEIARCWDTAENRARRARAAELAAAQGVSMLNVALAFALAQEFPVFALVGPRTLEEIRTALPGARLELSREEMDWLENG